MDASGTLAAYPEDRRASCSAASGLWQIAKMLESNADVNGLDS